MKKMEWIGTPAFDRSLELHIGVFWFAHVRTSRGGLFLLDVWMRGGGWTQVGSFSCVEEAKQEAERLALVEML